MQIVVNDTNIFIDLIHTELIDFFFQLSFEVHTTDFIIGEIEDEEQEVIVQDLIDSGKLIVADSTFEEIEAIMSLQETKVQLSVPDCSVWYYSKTNNYSLVTGDGLLRKTASADGVDVKGILFILDELVSNELILPIVAADKLEYLLAIGNRLPKSECDKRIEEWRN